MRQQSAVAIATGGAVVLTCALLTGMLDS